MRLASWKHHAMPACDKSKILLASLVLLFTTLLSAGFVQTKATEEKWVILTPPAPRTLRINGPKVGKTNGG
jgi:hypothetical protein